MQWIRPGLFAEVGCLGVWDKLVAGLDGLGLARPSGDRGVAGPDPGVDLVGEALDGCQHVGGELASIRACEQEDADGPVSLTQRQPALARQAERRGVGARERVDRALRDTALGREPEVVAFAGIERAELRAGQRRELLEREQRELLDVGLGGDPLGRAVEQLDALPLCVQRLGHLVEGRGEIADLPVSAALDAGGQIAPPELLTDLAAVEALFARYDTEIVSAPPAS